MFADQIGTGFKAQDQKNTDEDGHSRTAGDSEGNGGNQRTSFLGIVSGFRSNDSGYRTLTELVRVRGALLGPGIGEEHGNRASQSRNHSRTRSDHPTFHYRPEVPERVLDPVPDTGASLGGEREVSLLRDRPAFGKEVEHLRYGKQPQGH